MISIPRGLTIRLSLLQAKNNVFKYDKNKAITKLVNKINFLQERLNSLITKSKNNYYKNMAANKLNKLQRKSNPYWSLLKCS